MATADSTVDNGFKQAPGGTGRNIPFFNEKNVPISITTSAATGGSNKTLVTFTVKDGAGVAVARPMVLDVYLSDAADGEGLTATTASGTVDTHTSSGTTFSTLVSKKALRVQTKDDGTYTLAITDTAKTAFYPCAVNPFTGECHVGTQLATANYGA